MIELIMAILFALPCHNPQCKHTFQEHLVQVMTLDDGDTGGETSHPPPPPPPPPTGN